MDAHFAQEFVALRLRVLEMAAYCEQALQKAVRALLDRNPDLAVEVVDKDPDINRMECEIDDRSLKLLALSQPAARDLRFVVGVMRMIVNLERIGDEAVNIAEHALMLSHRPPLPFSPQLEELARTASTMFRQAIKSFKDEDPEAAQAVCEADGRANDLDLGLLKRLIDYMLKESPAIERSVHTILVSRSLERVGDLSTNVAESVIFMIKGVNIKHRCGRI